MMCTSWTRQTDKKEKKSKMQFNENMRKYKCIF